METKTQVKLYDLSPYRHLFPKAQVIDQTVKMGATVSDTVDFIPMIVQKTQWQVEKFVDSELRGLSTYETCKKLWNFVKHHIRYKKDKRGVEQVRSARRLIHDGVGDCDCFTTFIDTCLTVLKIPTINRITKYGENFFQHIYPIVPVGNGNYIIMDCVVGKFNYEEPYTEKKDYKMDLQYLDGIDDQDETSKISCNVDAMDLLGLDGEIGDLGRKKKHSTNSNHHKNPNRGAKRKKFFQKVKGGLKKGFHTANRFNPAVALLRAGILASMKLNILKVGGNIKWAYLTDDQAKAKGADMNKFAKMKKILAKTEKIFFAAGGKPENLKKAILTGKGNRNHEVSGISADENTPMEQLIGTESYNSEFVDGLNGTEGLGVIATGAAITAATGVMATIAALIKSIGSIFPHKNNSESNDTNDSGNENDSDSGSDDNSGSGNDNNTDSTNNDGNNSRANNNSTTDMNSSTNDTNADQNSNTDDNNSSDNTSDDNSDNSNDENSDTPETNPDPSNTDETETTTDTTPVTTSDDSGGDDNSQTEDQTNGLAAAPSPMGIKAFWDNHKKWIKPVGIGLTVVGALWLGYKHFNEKNKKHKGQAELNGVPKHKPKKRKKGKKTIGRKSGEKKSHIALM